MHRGEDEWPDAGNGQQGPPFSKLHMAALLQFLYYKMRVVLGDTALVIQCLAFCLIRQHSRLCIPLS